MQLGLQQLLLQQLLLQQLLLKQYLLQAIVPAVLDIASLWSGPVPCPRRAT
jgi:hypothetical protein